MGKICLLWVLKIPVFKKTLVQNISDNQYIIVSELNFFFKIKGTQVILGHYDQQVVPQDGCIQTNPVDISKSIHIMADVPWETQDIGKRKLSAYSESYRKVLSSPEKLNIFFALRRQPHNNKDDKMRDPKTRLYRIINRNINISL